VVVVKLAVVLVVYWHLQHHLLLALLIPLRLVLVAQAVVQLPLQMVHLALIRHLEYWLLLQVAVVVDKLVLLALTAVLAAAVVISQIMLAVQEHLGKAMQVVLVQMLELRQGAAAAVLVLLVQTLLEVQQVMVE
tara:strand:+ start:388 stop:789 length:402 start_codon:yes stop_codon:yes gene_type:complete